MKNDIIVNYSKITGIRDNVAKYKSALETMEGTLNRIKGLLETENSGESISALLGQYSQLQNYIDSCKGELDDLQNLFAGYHYDMTSIIRPNNESKNTRVDKFDINQNLMSISDSVKEIGKIQRVYSYVKAFQTSTSSEVDLQTSYGWHPSEAGTKSVDEAQIKNQEENYRKLENIKSKIGEVSGKIEGHYDILRQEFDNKIGPYVDMDDTYASKAKSMYDKYASFGEKIGIFALNAQEVKRSVEDATGELLVGVLKDTWGIVKGLTIYTMGVMAAEQEASTGVKVSEENQKYIEAFKKGNKMFENILSDPEAAVEGMIEGAAQEISDAYDQKGPAYCLTYGAGTIALGYGGDKLWGKFMNIAFKGDDVLNLGKIVIGGKEIDMFERLASRGISKSSIEVVVNKLDTGDLEKLYKYLEKKPIDFKCDDIIDRIEKGDKIDDIVMEVSKADRLKLSKWKYPPSDELYLANKKVYDNEAYFNQVTGDVIYPGTDGDVNIDGFVNGKFNDEPLTRGKIIDRYGDNGSGRYFSPDGSSFESRALPPFMKNMPYERYEVLRDFECKVGDIAPWFDQKGMGTQFFTDYKIIDIDGDYVEATVENLINNGYIKKLS